MSQTQTTPKLPKTGLVMRSKVHDAARRQAQRTGRPVIATEAPPRLGSEWLRRPLVTLPPQTA